MTPELKKAFDETHYIVQHPSPFTLRIGEICPELDTLLLTGGHEGAAFITAWNPYSESLSPQENACNQRLLVSDLEALDLKWVPGIGQHPSNGWPGEESVLILGIELRAAKALATKYGQWAFVWTPASGVSTLVTLSRGS